MKERLQKVLARAGVASRRASEKLILSGQVSVNGQVVASLGTKVDSNTDIIEIYGNVIRISEADMYVLYNKPEGIVSTAKDPQGRPTVVDMIGVETRIYPVGRLDLNTSGLLLLTNDGNLTYRLTHPKHEIEKVYIALIQGRISPTSIERLSEGVVLEDGLTAPARCKLVAYKGANSEVKIAIHEGRNRQVRRMFAHVGHRVLKLCRVRLGPLTVAGLKKGQWRFLEPSEVDMLKKV